MQGRHHENMTTLTEAQRFALLINGITDYALYMLDPDGFVVSWNSGAQKIKGYHSNEIIGQHFSKFFSQEDQERGLPARILEKAKTHGHFEAEGWRIRKDGTRFWANAVIDAIRDDKGELIGFAKIIRDITERRAAHDALFESEHRFRLLIQAISDYAIYMLDPNGIVTNWNSGAERLKGYKADEIVGQHFSRFYTKEDRLAGLPIRVLETALRTGHYEAEGWRVRKDGSRFWASVTVEAIKDENGKTLGFAKITRDITERKTAQDALRESERQFRMLIDGVTDYALYMLDPNGIITNWNRGAQRIKGYTAAEVVGHHFSRFYTAQDRLAGLPARALHTAEYEGHFEAEGWRVRKDNTYFWANVVIDPIRDENGTLVGFAKITRDITERREAQLALQKAQAERDRAQKMEVLGQLTGGVAHDFNNLLMIVSGHIQALKKLLPDQQLGQHSIAMIEAATRRGQSLTRQLLTFSRRQVLNPVPVEIASHIDSFRTMLESSVGSPYKLIASILPGIWPVKIDVDEFELSLLNLTLNARDAMPNGGVITYSAENVELRGGDAPDGLTGEFVALTVADTGCGIAPDVLPKIFDPFFTTKDAGLGTGLGLAQVYGFAHQSGGTVSVTSELGKGTSFTLFLCRSTAASDQNAVDTEGLLHAEGTLLLVEDNPDVAEATAPLIEELGFHVETARNASSALEALARRRISVVISDIVMAGPADGIQLGRSIHEQYPDIPVILVTGYNNNSCNEAQSEFTVLRKPYTLADLSRAIATVSAAQNRAAATNVISISEASRKSSDH
jgi:PAS domain S-box-containing protein